METVPHIAPCPQDVAFYSVAAGGESVHKPSSQKTDHHTSKGMEYCAICINGLLLDCADLFIESLLSSNCPGGQSLIAQSCDASRPVVS